MTDASNSINANPAPAAPPPPPESYPPESSSDVLVGIARHTVVLDIRARALGNCGRALPILVDRNRPRGGRHLFASLPPDDDEADGEGRAFRKAVLGWRPSLRSRAEMQAIVRAIGNDLGLERARNPQALHYFELLRRH